jgi:nucleoid-associated protein YgaU
MYRAIPLVRAAGVAVAAVAGWVAGVGVLAWATRGILAGPGPMGFDALVGLAAACGAWAAFLWLSAGFVVAVGAALPSAAGSGWDRLARQVAPAGVRRAARVLVGALIVTGVAGAAIPAAADTARPAIPAATAADPLPDLDRPTATGAASPISPSNAPASAAPEPATAATSPGPTRRDDTGMPDRPRPSEAAPADPDRSPVTVTPGDTLWDIAAAHLGRDATNSDIATEWPRWYAENRAVIGADPDRIFPGQRLLPPSP